MELFSIRIQRTFQLVSTYYIGTMKKIKTFWRLYIKNFSIFDKNIF